MVVPLSQPHLVLTQDASVYNTLGGWLYYSASMKRNVTARSFKIVNHLQPHTNLKNKQKQQLKKYS